MNAPFSDPADLSDPTDPYARPAQTFPRLDTDMTRRAAAYGRQQSVAAGEFLFKRGERHVDFFLIIAGRIEILEPGSGSDLQRIALHGASEFTGEIDLFSDRENLVSARAAEDSWVTRIDRAAFRQLMAAEPDIAEIIMRALILRRLGFIVHQQAGAVVLGPGSAVDTLRLQRFMTRNSYPYKLVDVDADPQATEMASFLHLAPHDLPAVLLPGQPALRNPLNAALADALGITTPVDVSRCYDVAVVGAGPAGLAAAVYAASEGLGTIVIEGLAPGGQAGTSSNIENYLGFPTGVPGQVLAARAQMQAQKFGAHLLVSRTAIGIDVQGAAFCIQLDDGQTVHARAVVIATGARYRKIDAPGCARFEGQGVHYAATAMEAQLCADQDVIVAGGGNSAGQAAVFLSRTVRHVHIFVRADGLAASMSDYLVQRIASAANITLHTGVLIDRLEGDPALRRVHWHDRHSGEAHSMAVMNIFVMIGASPNTQWLGECVKIDASGFVCTGIDLDSGPSALSPFETSRRGIFAVGDVRSGSIKRVASGVGEGSVVVHAVHRYLGERGQPPRQEHHKQRGR